MDLFGSRDLPNRLQLHRLKILKLVISKIELQFFSPKQVAFDPDPYAGEFNTSHHTLIRSDRLWVGTKIRRPLHETGRMMIMPIPSPSSTSFVGCAIRKASMP
jgi:hypothetical protein